MQKIVQLALAMGSHIFFSVANASDLPNYCQRTDVVQISARLYPNRIDSQSFVYRYQLVQTDTSKPVVIYLPGGPGQTSISADPKGPFSPLPPTLYNVIYTDQRGTGCNPIFGEKNPSDLYRSRYFAEDVVELIRDLHRRGVKRYVLYGHSFGTLHSTKVAALVQEKRKAGESIFLPEAVVLEGVIGKVAEAGEALRAYQNEWDKVRARLTINARDAVSIANPLGIAPSNWGYFIMQNLYLGRMPEATHIADLNSYLESLALPEQDPKYR